jgi:hypothetical protein
LAPNGDTFALPESTAQGVRHLLCIAQQTGKAPAPAWRRSIDQRGSRSPRTRGVSQRVANRAFEHRLRPIANTMRDCCRVVHLVHQAPFHQIP